MFIFFIGASTCFNPIYVFVVEFVRLNARMLDYSLWGLAFLRFSFVFLLLFLYFPLFSLFFMCDLCVCPPFRSFCHSHPSLPYPSPFSSCFSVFFIFLFLLRLLLLLIREKRVKRRKMDEKGVK